MKKGEALYTVSAVIEFRDDKLEKKELNSTFREEKNKTAVKAYAEFIERIFTDAKGKPIKKLEFKFIEEGVVLK